MIKRMDERSGPAKQGAAAVSGGRRWRLWLSGALILGGLIVLVVHRGEIGQVLNLAAAAQPLWLAAALALQALTYVSAASVWYLVLRRAGHPYPLRALVPLGLAKLFADQAMPSAGMSGTAFFVATLSRRGVPGATCLAALLVSVVAYYSAYLAVALASLVVLWLHHAMHRWIVLLAALFMFVAPAIPAGLLWLQRRGQRPLPAWLRRLPGAELWLRYLDEAPDPPLLRGPWLVLAAAVPHATVFLLDAGTLWIVLRAIGEPVSFLIALPAFVLGSIAATLGPIPLGLGTFEATCVGVLSILGVSIEGALAATLLLRGFTLWLPMLPGLWLARREISRPPTQGS